MMLNKTVRAWQSATLVVATVLASAAPFAAAAKDRQNFTAGIQISEFLVPGNFPGCEAANPMADSTALGIISGSGLGTVIGAFTIDSVDCVRSASPSFSPPFTFSSTSFKLTTASGDQIIATYGGTAVLQPSGVLVLKGNFTFTGGTGRYSKVKGGGTLLGVQNITTIPATGVVTLSGTLSP